VLLKGVGEQGFAFYTNQTSRKGRELAANPHAAAVFPWVGIRRQVIVTGPVEPVPAEEADRYFGSRPRGSQLGAWASRQSEVVPGRAVIDGWMAQASARFAGEPVPRPPFWGGYRLVPLSVELWQGRTDRLHDRLRYRRAWVSDPWVIERLSP
jgi:pyridoxamine 5'-phosphate oxidase